MITIRVVTGPTYPSESVRSPLPVNRTESPGRSAPTHRTLYACLVPIYAAYGSNMHPEQMLQRAPHSPMAGTGWLEGWRLTFGGADIGWEGALGPGRGDPGPSAFVVLFG